MEQLGGARDLPGPRATLFFAPAQAKKRSTDWGASEFGRRLVGDWHAFRAQVAQTEAPWLQVQQHWGAAAVQQAYAAVLAGKGDPRLGHMLGFAPYLILLACPLLHLLHHHGGHNGHQDGAKKDPSASTHS